MDPEVVLLLVQGVVISETMLRLLETAYTVPSDVEGSWSYYVERGAGGTGPGGGRDQLLVGYQLSQSGKTVLVAEFTPLKPKEYTAAVFTISKEVEVQQTIPYTPPTDEPDKVRYTATCIFGYLR